MNLIIKRYKILIISFSMFFLIFNCFKPQKVNAIAGVDDALVIGGGVTITAGTVATVVGIGLTALGGYVVAENYDGSMLQEVVGDSLIASGNASKYIGSKVLETGQRVIQWTSDGIVWLKSQIDVLYSTVGDYPFVNGSSIGYSFTDSFVDGVYVPISSIKVPYDGYVNWSSGTSSGSIRVYANNSVEFSASRGNGWSSIARRVVYSSSTSGWGSLVSASGNPSLSICIDFAPSGTTVSQSGTRYKSDSVCPDNAGVCAQVPVQSVDSSSGSYGVSDAWDYGNLGGLDWGGVVDSFPDVIGTALEGSTDTDIDTDIPSDTTGDITSDGDNWVLNIPILGDILKVLLKILELLKTFVKTLIDALVSAITTLFVPSDTYFTDKFDGYRTTLIGKLGDNNFDFLQQSGSNIEDIYINIFGQQVCIVKITLFNKFKDFAFIVIRAFFYFFLILFNFNQIIKFLRGSIFSDYNSREAIALVQNDDNKIRITGKGGEP